jgi:prevent-host-death family protein
MSTAGIRELKQNASAVIAEVASGETVIITDRGRPVAQVSPIVESPYAAMRAAGLIRPATRPIRDLPAPEAGEPVSPTLEAMRLDERY